VSHDHDDEDQGHGPDWWQILDYVVIAAVVLILALVTEWLAGALVRERISRGAEKLLRRTAAQAPTE
jgi:hypothetical protein